MAEAPTQRDLRMRQREIRQEEEENRLRMEELQYELQSLREQNRNQGSYIGYMSDVGPRRSISDQNRILRRGNNTSSRTYAADRNTGTSIDNESQATERRDAHLDSVIDRDEDHNFGFRDRRDYLEHDVREVNVPRRTDEIRTDEHNRNRHRLQTRSYASDEETADINAHDRAESNVDISLETEKLEERLQQLRASEKTRRESTLDLEMFDVKVRSLQSRLEIDKNKEITGHIVQTQGRRIDSNVRHNGTPKRYTVEGGMFNISNTHDKDLYVSKPTEERVRGELDRSVDNIESQPASNKAYITDRAYKEESQMSLRQIQKSKLELQKLIMIEEDKQKQLLEQEKRRITELEKQTKMLDGLIEKEKEMTERERRLKKDELILQQRYEELELLRNRQIKSGEDKCTKLEEIEKEMVSKDEELKKRELDLRRREELLTEIHQKLLPEYKKETVIQHKPDISSFSGEDPKPKNEVTLDEWKTEIKSLIATNIYPDNLIAQAVRKSLKGQARKVLININPTATSEEIIEKIEDIFGDTSSKQTIFTEYYTASQREKESVADWGLRLEEILLKVSTKKQLSSEERNEMLKDKFWRSLYNKEIKNALRISFESTDTFEVLRKKARAEEHEIQMNREVTESKVFQQQKTTKDTDKHTDMLQTMMKKMEDL
ncbi:trichohyalin-like [Mercenaria mercenaria]|uniref:trichohyalin-like n=1 Tax=Mercenaria mercenaria TaxID=6596 RepID=UPI00234F2F10|nr:trichohyalin-like [Mercenaria mercenaria]